VVPAKPPHHHHHQLEPPQHQHQPEPPQHQQHTKPQHQWHQSKAAPRPAEAADAADAELVILDLRDHLDRTAKTEPMAHPALTEPLALMPEQDPSLTELNPAKTVLLLPPARPAALDPRDHPERKDPMVTMPMAADVVLPVPLDPLAHLELLVPPEPKDQPAQPERSPNQLELRAPTAVPALPAHLAQMEHPAPPATLVPLAQLAQLATLEPVLQPERMVHLAPRDPRAHEEELAAATTAHHHAPPPAIKYSHPSTGRTTFLHGFSRSPIHFRSVQQVLHSLQHHIALALRFESSVPFSVISTCFSVHLYRTLAAVK